MCARHFDPKWLKLWLQYVEMQAGGVSGFNCDAYWTISTVTVLKPRERDTSLAPGPAAQAPPKKQ